MTYPSGNGKQLPLQVQLQQSEDARRKLESTLADTERQLAAAQADVIHWRNLFVEYGAHKFGCGVEIYHKCDCGFEQLRNELSAAGADAMNVINAFIGEDTRGGA